MLEEFLEHPFFLNRHRQAPLLKERESFLSHLQQQGTRLSRPWNRSHFFAAYTKNEAELPYDCAFGFVRCSRAQQSAARWISSSDTSRNSVSFRRRITGSNSPERFLSALRLVPCCCRWLRNDSRSFSSG